jgi:hypothetical protein
MSVPYKNLKWGVFTSPQSGTKEFEMYIIENKSDLNKFFKVYGTSPLLKSVWEKYVGKDIILVYSNGCSWCTENIIDSTHPSSFNRVRLGQLTK